MTSRATVAAIPRRTLVERGFTRARIEAAVRSGELLVLAKGYYLAAADVGRFPEHQHLALARAVLADRADTDGLARISAAINLKLPVLGADLSRVHLARPGGTASGSRATAISVVHRNVDDRDLTITGGVRCTTPARTVVDLARTESVRTATMIGDAALRRKLCSMDDLAACLDAQGAVDGCGRARALIARFDGRAESPLESWSRLVIAASRLSSPDLQREIVDDRGVLVARVDFIWDEWGVVGECDGLGKYFGEYSDKSVREVLDEEKFRAQILTDMGYIVVRWTWNELRHQPELVIARIEKAIERARRQRR